MMAIVLILTMPAVTIPSADPWSRFTGSWRGPGRAMSSEAIGEARMAFQGRAFYKVGDTTGVWFDSQGSQYQLHYRMTTDTLIATWTMPNGTRARSQYVRTGNTMHERTGYVGSDGQVRTPFLEFTYTMQP